MHNEDYSTTVLFEHPLNEKMRTWLRLEFLLQQLYHHPTLSDLTQSLLFFRTLIDLLDILERGDIRNEMLKELDRQIQKLRHWETVQGVDKDRVNNLLTKLKDGAATLIAAPRLGHALRKDRFIFVVRQKLSIPGGGCSFELPTLHIWLHSPQQYRDTQVQNWLQTLEPFRFVLVHTLNIIRHLGEFKNQISVNGFFQDNIEKGDLLRFLIPVEHQIYPQISGHKTRYAVHFLSLDSDKRVVPNCFSFELACC